MICPICPKCTNESFRTDYFNLNGLEYDAILCSNCNTIIAAFPVKNSIIEDLEQKISDLEDKVDDLEDLIDNMENQIAGIDISSADSNIPEIDTDTYQ